MSLLRLSMNIKIDHEIKITNKRTEKITQKMN